MKTYTDARYLPTVDAINRLPNLIGVDQPAALAATGTDGTSRTGANAHADAHGTVQRSQELFSGVQSASRCDGEKHSVNVGGSPLLSSGVQQGQIMQLARVEPATFGSVVEPGGSPKSLKNQGFSRILPPIGCNANPRIRMQICAEKRRIERPNSVNTDGLRGHRLRDRLQAAVCVSQESQQGLRDATIAKAFR